MHLGSRSAYRKARPLAGWRFNDGDRCLAGEAKQDGVVSLGASAGMLARVRACAKQCTGVATSP
jgi:hypothetical protein